MNNIIQNTLLGIIMVGIAGAFFAVPFAFCDLITIREALFSLLVGGVVSCVASCISGKFN